MFRVHRWTLLQRRSPWNRHELLRHYALRRLIVLERKLRWIREHYFKSERWEMERVWNFILAQCCYQQSYIQRRYQCWEYPGSCLCSFSYKAWSMFKLLQRRTHRIRDSRILSRRCQCWTVSCRSYFTCYSQCSIDLCLQKMLIERNGRKTRYPSKFSSESLYRSQLIKSNRYQYC